MRRKSPSRRKKVQFVATIHPRPRYRRGDVPPGFQPVYVEDPRDGRVARYRCMARTHTLSGEIRQCCWNGRKHLCAKHKNHDFTLPPQDDPLFHAPLPLSHNRAKLNQRILATAAEFVTATNMSCRQAASAAMHDFIHNLIQIGACIQAGNDMIVTDVAGFLDQMTEPSLTQAIRATGDAKFAEAMFELGEIRYANLVVDAGTAHSLKTIVCLLTNPHSAIAPVLLALRENTNFTADDYSALFVELLSMGELSAIVICSVVVDNLPAQSRGLGRVLTDSPIIHVKCFAHMANLILTHTMPNGYFIKIMDALKCFQHIFRGERAVQYIQHKCPKFIRTRWFYMVDTLAYFVHHSEACTSYLLEFGADEEYYDGFPLEISELYIILLPFYCFIGALESRACALPYIVPLSRALLATLRDVFPLLRTYPVRQIFHELYIRLLSRLMANNREEALAAYSLTLQGRQEIRELEKGYSTRDANEPTPDPCVELKSFMRGASDFDSAIQSAVAMGENSDPFLVADEASALDLTARISSDDSGRVDGNDDERASGTPAYATYLVQFAEMPDGERMAFDPYRRVYEMAHARIGDLAARLGSNPEETLTLFDSWLFDSAQENRFVLDPSARESVNSMWRIAHRYEKWSTFADLALRLISCGTSEADAERVLSMQKNIASLHGTRFGISTMEARLRTLTGLSKGRKDHAGYDQIQEVSGGTRMARSMVEELGKESADEGNSDSDSVADDDSDRE